MLILGIYELPAENRENRKDRDQIIINFKYNQIFTTDYFYFSCKFLINNVRWNKSINQEPSLFCLLLFP